MATLVFCCGAECGVNAAGASGGTLHWNTYSAQATVDTTTTHGNGSTRAYKITASAQTSRCAHTISTQLLVARAWINFTTFPSANMAIFGGFDGTNSVGLGIKSTGQIVGQGVTSYGTVGPTINTGEWHLIECKANVAANPWLIDFTVDGVSYTQFSVAQAATTITSAAFGSGGSHTTTWYIDDMAWSTTSGDYPLGNGTITGLQPNRDGTHSFTANDFSYNNTTPFAPTATDVYTYLDDRLDNITDFIACIVGTASVRYVRIGFASLSNAKTINGLEVVSAHHAAGTAADQQSLRLDDGGTKSTIMDNVDLSQTTICYNTKHYATAPSSGGAWTKAKVDALWAEWGNIAAAIQDVSPVPFVDGLILEVDQAETLIPRRLIVAQAMPRGSVI